MIKENDKDMTPSRFCVSNIKDILREKFIKTSMQSGLDIGIADKTNVSIVDNRGKKKEIISSSAED